jgi:hypothetical protein
MKWGQVRKNKDIGLDSFVDSNMMTRASRVMDYLSEEDGRKPFILSILSRASKRQPLTARQLSYFESIEAIYLAREKALKSPPVFNRDLWRDRFIVDKSTVHMGHW